MGRFRRDSGAAKAFSPTKSPNLNGHSPFYLAPSWILQLLQLPIRPIKLNGSGVLGNRNPSLRRNSPNICFPSATIGITIGIRLLPVRVLHPPKKKMTKNLFTLAFAIALVSGLITGTGNTEEWAAVDGILNFFMYGAAAYIGWMCVSNLDGAKNYAIGAAALVFLNAPGWGNASAAVGGIEYVGPVLSAWFGNFVNIVLLVAAVGLLRSLVDGARSTANAG